MDSLFRQTLGPLGWTAMLLLPPAVFALYFLKLRREPLEVPSTYLWARVVQDLHVNSLWQRLRRNLLLLLQLAILGLAMLALLRPGWQGTALEGRRFIFLLDRSASMSATDDGDTTRLDRAAQRIGELVDQMDSGMSAMIVAFADQPDVVQEFTGNRRLLREALARVAAVPAGTRIRGALELADDLANPARVTIEEGGLEVDATAQEPVELMILSDGLFEPVEGYSLGNLRPKFFPIGSRAAANLAVTAFNVRRNELRPEQRQAFVQVGNFSDEEQTCVVQLFVEGRLTDAARLACPPGDLAGAVFELGDSAAGVLEARLDPPDGFRDAVALDNRAYAAIDRAREVRVLLVSEGNAALEAALQTDRARQTARIERLPPARLADEQVQRDLQSAAYDLVVFDACAPASMPAANTVFVGRVPPLAAWRAQASPQPVAVPQIVDWRRDHPLLHLVEWGNVELVDSLTVRPPLGGAVLVDSTAGPVAAAAPRDQYEDVVLGFEIVGRNDQGEATVNTNWPRRLSFPAFWLNALEYLGGRLVDENRSYRPGDPVALPAREANAAYAVQLPDGAQVEAGPPRDGVLSWLRTEQLGVYRVLRDGRPFAQFAVNLCDPRESDVRLRPRQGDAGRLDEVASLSIGFVDVEAQPLGASVRKELWQPLLLAALAVVLLEWYIYNRRVYV